MNKILTFFSDFGWKGPYLGQVKSVLAEMAPDSAVIDLMHDAPTFNPKASAYLLAAMSEYLPAGSVNLCVVDPGVGSSRRPVMLVSSDRYYIGPDNGLFEILRRRVPSSELREILWKPDILSSSFHGRDLFAPVAARLAGGETIESRSMDDRNSPWSKWPDDLAEIIYLDAYGNAMTGLRADAVSEEDLLKVQGQELSYARTFSETNEGSCFWYLNSQGLVEIACNQGSAAEILNLSIGTPVIPPS